jgi:hypothetical protein
MQKQKLLLRQPQLKIVIILLKVNCTPVQCILKLLGNKERNVLNGMELTEPVANKDEKTMEVEIIKSKSSFSIDLILDDYLKLKCFNK